MPQLSWANPWAIHCQNLWAILWAFLWANRTLASKSNKLAERSGFATNWTFGKTKKAARGY